MSTKIKICVDKVNLHIKTFLFAECENAKIFLQDYFLLCWPITAMSADYSADGPEGTSHDGYVYVVSHKHYNDVFVNWISPPGRNPSVYDAWVGSNCDVTGVEPASAAFVMLDSDRERMRRYASEISSRRYRPTFLYQVR